MLALEDATSRNSSAGRQPPRIACIGPGSTRVIREVLEAGTSPTAEGSVDRHDCRADIERRRALRRHFLSRAEVLRILRDATFRGPTREHSRADVQLHPEWSDGNGSLRSIVQRRGRFCGGSGNGAAAKGARRLLCSVNMTGRLETASSEYARPLGVLGNPPTSTSTCPYILRDVFGGFFSA
jgi:hypothetical protein